MAGSSSSAVSRRALEIRTAAVAALVGVIVSAESLTHYLPSTVYLAWMMWRHALARGPW